ncbi:polyubiquitin [Rhipicephalus sanguineus]|uniref:polyubiquitin n=1 Tax=Rhipicephalus sanguineus TaxID=34632 RepID=UPI0018955F1E|nr:polyubiquitin [Rhipicephalus sanguineus]
MDSFAIPFPAGRTVAELPGGSNGDDDLHTNEEDVSREPLQLTVLSLMNKRTHVEAFASDSVLDLKLLLQDILLVPADQQLLVYRYQALTDSDTLEECGLRDGAQLTLILRMRGGDPTPVVLHDDEPLELSILIKRGKCVVVASRFGATVGSVKQSIEKLTGLPAARQTLTFRGQDMSDEHTLAHYELRDRCAVFLALEATADVDASAAAADNSQEPAVSLAGIAERLWNLFF